MFHCLRIPVCFILAFGCLVLPAAPPVVAETDLGPITLDDLAYQMRHHQDLPEGDLESERDWRHAAEILRITATEKLLLLLAEERGLEDDPEFQAELEAGDEDILIFHAYEAWITWEAYPTREEMWDQVHAHRDEAPDLPPEASFRFINFGGRPEDPEDVREDAWRRAREAHATLVSGEWFEHVAARLGNPPSTGQPGAIIGPTQFQGHVLPQLEEAIVTLPFRTPSEILDTPIGPVIIQVERRDMDRRGDQDFVLMWEHGLGLVAERRAERLEEFLTELRGRHTVAVLASMTAETPPETPILQVGERPPITMGELRTRVWRTEDPAAEITALLATPERSQIVERELLLSEMESTGLASDPQVLFDRDERRRQLILSRIRDLLASEREVVTTNEEVREHYLSRIRDLLASEREVVTTNEEVREHYASHTEDFVRDLNTLESLWISLATLSDLASSEMGADLLAQAEVIRQRWIDGESAAEILEDLGADPFGGNGAMRWERRPLRALPDQVRSIAEDLEPGEHSTPTAGTRGMMIVHLISREEGNPELGDIYEEVQRSLRAASGFEESLTDDLLQRHGYRPVIETSRLRWGDPGELILIEPDAEEGQDSETDG